MKKIKIGYLNYEATQQKTKTKQKEAIYQKAYALCHLYVTIENVEELIDKSTLMNQLMSESSL
jgi:hypothetical protein